MKEFWQNLVKGTEMGQWDENGLDSGAGASDLDDI